MHREQLVATTRAFLMRQPVFQRPSPVFISLSGGVDSMVIGKILVHLRDGGDSSVGDVIAIHVDYGNREESAAEAEYVSQWCGRQGIRFVCRRITEVRRGITARDDFERISRELRYSTYHEAISANKHADDTVESYGVIFGHHQGDLQENVISNVMRGCSPLQLSGMSESSLINGVYVWRPLLPHLKEHILEFAHKYGVPYFRDTTVSRCHYMCRRVPVSLCDFSPSGAREASCGSSWCHSSPTCMGWASCLTSLR
jgi:tRNA(Ile)-lysidine synthetase-like protein